jgi:hypothetical protein
MTSPLISVIPDPAPVDQTPLLERLYRWQVIINAAFAGGSLTAALLNLGALVAVSMARSGMSHFGPGRHWAEYRG